MAEPDSAIPRVRLELFRDEGDQASGKNSGRAEPEPTEPHPVVKPFVGPSTTLHCSPLSVRGSASAVSRKLQRKSLRISSVA